MGGEMSLMMREVPLRTEARRQIMRGQDRGRDKRGSTVNLCKQRLLFRIPLVEELCSRQCSANTLNPLSVLAR